MHCYRELNLLYFVIGYRFFNNETEVAIRNLRERR